eukprot:gnl/Dysnectes_brevis/1890_a2172_2617.p1 GENE.gnl/Dysnectes_brevis/1890_a2172_2617~~gnl/Dysnectes_brevis/1890_a2172_2617.p1  ORF type:complete len:267 (+),score=39.05 gnl/Dysnectes_brevis/1890_a2172_2617:27-803(+)
MNSLLLLTVLIAVSFCKYDGLYGLSLRTALKQDYYDGRLDSLGYDEARREMYAYIYNSPETNSVIGIYSGLNMSYEYGDPNMYSNGDINCEHIIPQSKFNKEEPMRSDLHHIRPSYKDVNGARSNYRFQSLNASSVDMYYMKKRSRATPPRYSDVSEWSKLDSSTAWQPRDVAKGNVARAVFYFFTMYPQYIYQMEGPTVYSVDEMVEWSEAGGVDDDEYRRNGEIEDAQGVRNPYIDSPELVRRAYCDYLVDGCSQY